MSVRAEVERVEQAATAPAQQSPAQYVRTIIAKQSKAFDAVLPSTVDTDRFARLVLTAVKSTPDLMQCFATPQGETSVLLAAMQAAAVGLEPNTPTQECWLLPRRRDGVWEAQLSIGYRGYLKLTRRSGSVRQTVAEVVRQGDVFDYGVGADGPYLEWKPGGNDDPDPANWTHVFAKVWLTNGAVSQIVLTRQQVEARRAASDSWRNERARPYSPWTRWPDAMWRKSAIRALVPFLDLDPESERAVINDEHRLRLNDEDGVIEADEPRPSVPEIAPPADVESGPAAVDGDDVAATEEGSAPVAAPDWESLPDDVESVDWIARLGLEDMQALAVAIGATVPRTATVQNIERLARALDEKRRS